jgi:hypothetical protein
VRELLDRLHVLDDLGPDGVYPTVEAAVSEDHR